MDNKKQNLKLNNTTNNTNYSTFNELNKTFFPSLTLKELLSIHDLKLKTNNNIRTKVKNNFYRNFHSEIMKTNLIEKSKYSSLYKDSTFYNTKTETKFPCLTQEKKEPLVKLYMDPNTISSIINKSINKDIKINYKTIFNNNSTSKKYNISNLSTTGNISPSMKSYKISSLDKIKANSVDFNGSLFNQEKEENSLRNNSSIKYTKTETFNNNSIYTQKELNKKFVSSLNPIYSSLKKEILSEFNKKTKDINYLKFILMKNKKDIEIQEEKRISDIERIDQILFSIQTMQKLYDKYSTTKYEYLNYLQKEISKENEENEILEEEKITLMKEIYTIRHKTLRLENRFKNYLDDKFFLLSVKNHSFKIDKFDPEDRADYNKDLQKLEILNFMLKITSKEYSSEEIRDRRKHTTRKYLLNPPSSKNNTLANFQRSNNKRKSSRRNLNNITINPLLSMSKKRVFTRNSVLKPIYNDVYYFNKDLQETKQKIQDSLDIYNKNIKELNIEKQNLEKTKKEMKDIREYEIHMKKEIIVFRKDLENLKKLNNGLFNYKKYLENIFILNLNKGKVLEKINIIIDNIEQSEDNILLNFLINKFNDYNRYLISGLDKLKLIECVLEYLLEYKFSKKKEKNEKYYLIQKKIDDTNRINLSKKKQALIKERFNLLIKKVIDKNKKIIVLQRKKVHKDMRIYLRKNRTDNSDNKDNNNDYFGNFDIL